MAHTAVCWFARYKNYVFESIWLGFKVDDWLIRDAEAVSPKFSVSASGAVTTALESERVSERVGKQMG